jgi:hypothetical protein
VRWVQTELRATEVAGKMDQLPCTPKQKGPSNYEGPFFVLAS